MSKSRKKVEDPIVFARVTQEQHDRLEEEAQRRRLPAAAIIREMLDARYQTSAVAK